MRACAVLGVIAMVVAGCGTEADVRLDDVRQALVSVAGSRCPEISRYDQDPTNIDTEIDEISQLTCGEPEKGEFVVINSLVSYIVRNDDAQRRGGPPVGQTLIHGNTTVVGIGLSDAEWRRLVARLPAHGQ
jgi:hypothetical protein